MYCIYSLLGYVNEYSAFYFIFMIFYLAALHRCSPVPLPVLRPHLSGSSVRDITVEH